MFNLTGWTSWCLLVGVFGQVGFLADFLKPRVPDWLAITSFLVPVVLAIFVRPNEVSDTVARRCHFIAAAWYISITIMTEVLALVGYLPAGALLYRILMHLGWLHCWKILRSQNHTKPNRDDS